MISPSGYNYNNAPNANFPFWGSGAGLVNYYTSKEDVSDFTGLTITQTGNYIFTLEFYIQYVDSTNTTRSTNFNVNINFNINNLASNQEVSNAYNGNALLISGDQYISVPCVLYGSIAYNSPTFRLNDLGMSIMNVAPVTFTGLQLIRVTYTRN